MVDGRGGGPRPERQKERPGSHRPELGGARRPVTAGEERFGWAVLSYLITGMALYGAAGWFAGRWTHLPVLFPVGMVTGLGFAIVLVIFRVRAR